MTEQLQLPLGLSSTQSDLSGISYDSSTPILDRLQADTKFHDTLRSYFLERLTRSERRMQQFHSRWRANELKVQAYITLPDYEKMLQSMNKEGKPPSPVSITFPYAYATTWTIVTYFLHTFCGRSPMFQVQASKAESIVQAQNMEKLLQWNADTTRLVRWLYQYFMDSQVYGVGILRTLWKVKKTQRSSIIQPQGIQGLLAKVMGDKSVLRQRSLKVVFEGNEVESVDPFMFFPDPNVPMTEVNRKGEYVFWRTFVGKHELLSAEAQGQIKGTAKVTAQLPSTSSSGIGQPSSMRGAMVGGDGIAAFGNLTGTPSYYQFDQGSVIIIPKELGLGDSSFPERWLVGIVNKQRIVQLEPLDVEHDMHPVSVIEPTSFGYGLGQPGLVDFIGPVQDTLSWLLNSHIHNTRAAMNNSFIVDPSMVEMQDLKNPEPGKLIRLKRAAFGQDVRQAISQLNVQDVTRGHIMDLQVFQKVADTVSAVGDNMRGIQDSGGRKTATEVRTSGEAGASRLAAQARLISAQGMTSLTEQMSTNLQSKLSGEVMFSVLGAQGMAAPVSIGPEQVMGDFYYPVHDGTLPLDKVALFDLWRQLLMGLAQDPELRAQYDLGAIFAFTAKLGGADNIEQFKAKVAPPGAEPPPGSVNPLGAPMQ